jgi:hypothetical protein
MFSSESSPHGRLDRRREDGFFFPLPLAGGEGCGSDRVRIMAEYASSNLQEALP